MDSKPLTSEAIALTEKKMEMSLDDIIKMSKNNTSKGKKPRRLSIKSQGLFQRGPSQPKSSKVQNFLESRSSIRQGALAQRRTNFSENQFPLTTEAARKAVATPIQNMVVNRNRARVAPIQRKAGDDKTVGKGAVLPKQRQTLDARFASIREQKIGAVVSQPLFRGGGNQNTSRIRGQQQQNQQPSWQPRGRGGSARHGPGRRFGNFRR